MRYWIWGRARDSGWNHREPNQHFKTYYAVPLLGDQLHTINAVLEDEKAAYIIEDTADEFLFVDPGELASTVERFGRHGNPISCRVASPWNHDIAK